jgi:hypothetical protein
MNEELLPRHPEEVMQELLGELKAQRTAALKEIEQEAQELFRDAMSARELAEQFAPDAVLSASERDAVAERLPLIERDVASLRDADVEARLRGVLRGSGKVDQYLYWTAARKRAREVRERQAQAARANGNPNTSTSVTGTPFDGAIAALEGVLLGEERQRRTENAQQVVDAASGVVDRCVLARNDAKDSWGLYMKRAGYHAPPDREAATVPPGLPTIAREA